MEELQAGDPRQVGGYTLLARLGSGGLGQVYFGRSPAGRTVAVKVIRADLARDRGFRLRFAREVKAARRVSGAFTAPVIDADPDAPVPWLVTGYVRGPSLADATGKSGQRDITAFTGTISWDVPELPDGCASSRYEMRVTSTSS